MNHTIFHLHVCDKDILASNLANKFLEERVDSIYTVSMYACFTSAPLIVHDWKG
jgi:hypothetical protein